MAEKKTTTRKTSKSRASADVDSTSEIAAPAETPKRKTKDVAPSAVAHAPATNSVKAKAPEPRPMRSNVSERERYHMIAEAAYFMAEKRGFGAGDPVNDWLAAEREVDAKLRQN